MLVLLAERADTRNYTGERLPRNLAKLQRPNGSPRVGCPVCAHFVHYTSRRNRVPPRRGFRVEVQ